MVTGVVSSQFARCRGQNKIPVLDHPRAATALEFWNSTNLLFFMNEQNGPVDISQVHLGFSPLSKPPD